MSFSLLKKQIACCLAMLLMVPAGQAFASPRPSPQNGEQSQSAAPATPNSQAAQPSAQNESNAAPAAQTQQPPKRPVGTAVAPYEKSSGFTASRPAGAVIAPAKQRRVRAIFIKVAVVIGAAAAIGAVAALSHSSPSQPH